MTARLIDLIEVGGFIIAVLSSLGVGLHLRHSAKVHEEAAASLGKKIER